jgi:acetylornithine deacetylase/succinyl-diaminopimelate desuccinylase-like protein
MTNGIDAVVERLRGHAVRHLDALRSLVEVPSVSRIDGVGAEMLHAAGLIAQSLRDVGLERTELIELDGAAPYVIAQSPEVPGAPTVLLYAHYDVQPAGDIAGWASAPFEPDERGGRLYGRGTADDKGGVIAHIAALEAWLGGAGALPLTVKVLIEGEEEIGSRHFRDLLAKHADLLACDVVVIPDSMGWEIGHPSITCSTRGALTGVVEFTGLPASLHSGIWGGVNPDPTLSLCSTLANLLGPDGKVDLEILRDRDRRSTDPTMRRLRRLTKDEVIQRLGVQELVSAQDGISDRLWDDACMTVVGFDAPAVAAAPLAIQSSARAKINLRLPPGVDPEQAADEVSTKIRERTPRGLRSSVTFTSVQAGWVADLTDPAYPIAQAALESAYGRPAMLLGSGGTLPLLRWIAKYLQEPTCIILGIEDPSSNAHGVDESISLADWQSLCVAETLLLGKLPQLRRSKSGSSRN